MSTEPPPADVVGMRVSIKLDATVTLVDSLGNATDWLKPGVESSMKWNGVPTEEQLRSGVAFMRDHVVTPTLEEVLGTVTERTQQIRRAHY